MGEFEGSGGAGRSYVYCTPMQPDDDGLDSEALSNALQTAPAGAFALAGLTVGLLIAAWLLIYVFVFLPRGPVG
jgi:hypothetical protein